MVRDVTHIRAIVFDLDDTLVDTTGQLLEPAHLDAATAMIAAGLPGTAQEVAQARIDLSRAHPGESVDLLVAHRYGCEDDAVVMAGHRAFYERRVRRLDAFPDAHAVLRELGEAGVLRLLVTAGHPPTQRQKLTLAGLDELLDGIRICDYTDPDKQGAIAELMAEHSVQPQETLVIGDRLDREIAAARRLGCWAVRVAHGEGRYSRPTTPDEQPHYTVPGIEALMAVLEDLAAGD